MYIISNKMMYLSLIKKKTQTPFWLRQGTAARPSVTWTANQRWPPRLVGQMSGKMDDGYPLVSSNMAENPGVIKHGGKSPVSEWRCQSLGKSLIFVVHVPVRHV